MTLRLELPPDIENALTQTAQRRGQTLAEAAAEELRLLHPTDGPTRERLAVALYHARLVPQGDAAALAGLSRAEFLDALARHGVAPIRYDADEAFEDAARIAQWDASTAPPDTPAPPGGGPVNPTARALIVDASPFIGLAKIGREDLLTLYRCPVLLPETVAREIEAGPVGDPARLALGLPWVERRPDAIPPPALTGFRLDAGERAVLSLGLTHPGALLVLDDGDGRRAARTLSLPFTGTVGVALQARQTGHLPALAPTLRDLRRVGLYLPTDAQIRQLLAPFGELWP